jgi:hypothetical protein
MGNPYYIEPQQSPILNFTNQLMHLKLAKEDQLLRQRGQEQAGQQFNIQQWGTPEAQAGMPTLQQRQVENQTRQVGLQEQQQRATEAQSPHTQNFGTVSAKLATSNLTGMGVKKDNPIFAEIQSLADNPNVNNGQAYLYLKDALPNHMQNLKNEIADNYVSAYEKDPNYASTPQGKKQLAVLDALDKDPTGKTVLDQYFGGTVRGMEMEERKLKGAQTPVIVQDEDGNPMYVSAEEAMAQGYVPYRQKDTNQTTEQLMARAIKGDKEAQGILDALEKREIRMTKNKGQVRISLNQPTKDEVSSTVDLIANGQMAPNTFLNKRGRDRALIFKELKDRYPKFDLNKAEANYKYMTNPNNLRTIGLVAAARPRVEALIGKIDALQNSTKIPIADKPLNAIKRDLGGNVPIVDYESLRNAIIQEVNTALSGSSVISDYRIKLELENLGSNRSPNQLKVAVNNLLTALDARTDASLAIPYSWEEVRGEKPGKGPAVGNNNVKRPPLSSFNR